MDKGSETEELERRKERVECESTHLLGGSLGVPSEQPVSNWSSLWQDSPRVASVVLLFDWLGGWGSQDALPNGREHLSRMDGFLTKY